LPMVPYLLSATHTRAILPMVLLCAFNSGAIKLASLTDAEVTVVAVITSWVSSTARCKAVYGPLATETQQFNDYLGKNPAITGEGTRI